MDKVEVTEKNIERQFILAVEFFGMYFPNMLHFYALFHKRANNKIKSLRLAVRTGVTPYIEYNEEWVCNCESGLFSFILAIELYRFINHHCTHRLLTGENAYKASTAVCNTKDLKICLRNVSKEVNDFLEKNIWSRKLIEAELGKPVLKKKLKNKLNNKLNSKRIKTTRKKKMKRQKDRVVNLNLKKTQTKKATKKTKTLIAEKVDPRRKIRNKKEMERTQKNLGEKILTMSLEELMETTPEMTDQMMKKIMRELENLSPLSREILLRTVMIAIRGVERVQDLQMTLSLLQAAISTKMTSRKTSKTGTRAAKKTQKSGAKTTS